MNVPVRITFKNMDRSDFAEEWVHSEVAKLETFYDRITGCHVTIDIPHRHHRSGNVYHVRVDVAVPRSEIVVRRTPSLRPKPGEITLRKQLEVKSPHKDLRLAINDAFKIAGRRLQDYVRRHRESVSEPAVLSVARPARLRGSKKETPGAESA